MRVNNVLTKIMNKWPVGQWQDPNFKIWIQQDGASGHCRHDDDYLADALEDLGLTNKVSFYTQPATQLARPQHTGLGSLQCSTVGLL